jgi:2-polyprenyl-6-methoxyphenol hydroxylase-like FAD-dependent oxidoreductase
MVDINRHSIECRDTCAITNVGAHAVVLGASMGGLLAARVLADFYEAVTVVERDVLPDNADNRRGVPQGRHAHLLWGRGAQILDELFPGFVDELVTAGAPVVDYRDLSRVSFTLGGHEALRTGHFKDHPPMVLPSRPLLECHVRRRVRALPNVVTLEGHDIVALGSMAARNRVSGARVCPRDGGSERTLAADLVVDATGRGSRTPNFLDELGYGRPTEDHLDVKLMYSSQPLRMPPSTAKELAVVVSPVPGRPTGVALFANENGTSMFTIFGMMGHEPPDGRAEMLAFAEELLAPHVLAAVRGAEPVGAVSRYRYPGSQWRRYDKMRRFPEGLLVFGDAICSFNPIYAQGMTVAALQAVALDRCLRDGADDMARRFFRAAAKPIGVAWQLAVGGDLSLPEVQGPRPLSVRLMNRYVHRLQAAAANDRVVGERVSRVIAFVDSPMRLLQPNVAFRTATLAHGRRKNRPS